jgi:hypothetical protein
VFERTPIVLESPVYEYKLVNLAFEREEHPGEIDDTANRYAQEGWRVVSFVPAKAPGYSECLLLERVKARHDFSHQNTEIVVP